MRFFGDLVVAAFFEGEKSKEREAKRTVYANAVVGGEAERYGSWLEEWRHAKQPLAPFHWEIEFPEVFERENPGFDAIVGNPPFAGKNSVIAANVSGYVDWLKNLHEESHGNSDLVAHFFRRAFNIIRQDGAFGLIATNTISQGDTRSSGLRWICQHGGDIFAVTKRVKWPGLAAVVVSVLHVRKGAFRGPRRIDDRTVERISAFLFHRGGHDAPARLAANAGKSFQGSIVLGMGFTFDDTDTKGVATPLSEMRRLIEADPRNQEVIFPYIGGEEVNTNPTHAHHRYVINFAAMSEAECRRRWPKLVAVVEEKVRGARGNHSTAPWWQFERLRSEMYAVTAGLDRVLVKSRTSDTFGFACLPSRTVLAESTVVIAMSEWQAFCVLQGRLHEGWARFFGTTFKDDLVYGCSTCFETFPFPQDWERRALLEAAGKIYYEFRAALMVRNNEGLTKTYNRFHDPGERNPEILKLRELHAAMDRAVFDAYGWTDLPLDCEFLLDYDVDEEEWGKKKKPYRYRWPDEVRDEVLARLLELNAVRAKEEARSGAAAAKTGRKQPAERRVRAAGARPLFDPDETAR